MHPASIDVENELEEIAREVGCLKMNMGLTLEEKRLRLASQRPDEEAQSRKS